MTFFARRDAANECGANKVAAMADPVIFNALLRVYKDVLVI